MKNVSIQDFKSYQLPTMSSLRGGITVACKDKDGVVLGTFQTDCLDPSYYLSDCKLNWANTDIAVAVPHP